MTLKVYVNDIHFQYELRAFQDACLVLIWWLQPKSSTSLCADKTNFFELLVKMVKITLKVLVHDLQFQF